MNETSIAIIESVQAFAEIYTANDEISIRDTVEDAEIELTPMGERGPPGPRGELAGYLHTQLSASDTWTINHNLGIRPVVALHTVGGVEFDGQVTHISENQCVVSLTVAVAGFARCS